MKHHHLIVRTENFVVMKHFTSDKQLTNEEIAEVLAPMATAADVLDDFEEGNLTVIKWHEADGFDFIKEMEKDPRLQKFNEWLGEGLAERDRYDQWEDWIGSVGYDEVRREWEYFLEIKENF